MLTILASIAKHLVTLGMFLNSVRSSSLKMYSSDTPYFRRYFRRSFTRSPRELRFYVEREGEREIAP